MSHGYECEESVCVQVEEKQDQLRKISNDDRCNNLSTFASEVWRPIELTLDNGVHIDRAKAELPQCLC